MNYIKFIKNIYYKLQSQYFILKGMKPWSKGYNYYKMLEIQKILSANDFNPHKLTKGYGYRLDERIVEYAWFFSRLPSTEGKLLDAGSVLNFSYILAHPNIQSKKMFISTLAPESLCFWNQGISYVYEDLRYSSFRDEYFDWIASLSTIEHIGLDNTMLYTDDTSKNEDKSASYLSAIKEYHRMLKTGGKLYLSFPYGKHINRKWFQIFDGPMIDEIVDIFRPTQQQIIYYKYEADGWKVSNREEAKDATYHDIHTENGHALDYAAASRAIVCLELVK